MSILTLETASLGDRTYVVHDGTKAAVVDPQRDVDRLLSLLDEHDLDLVAVVETHVHNDYVSGGLELVRRTGATWHMHRDSGLTVDHVGVVDGDEVEVGAITLRATAAPGHTFTHLAWVASDDEGEQAVFTGGSMLFGSVGRTDLLGDENTDELTRLQHRSVRGLAETLDGEVEVMPTHGFGSFCSSGDTSGKDSSTIAQEREDNQALQIDDEDQFVRELLAGLDDHPAYYAHMSPLNLAGPQPVDLTQPPRVDADELRRRVEAGEWVVDLRSAETYAAAHLPGTVNVGLADSASTYLAWVIPWGTPVTLLGDEDDVAAMQRQLVRVGIDRPAGWAPAADGDAGYPRSDFAGLHDALENDEDLVVLDVRRDLEWEDGHVEGAVHVPLHRLLAQMDEVPSDTTVWVHCASGYRASIAASLLDRADRDVVLVDDDFSSASDHFDLVD